MSDGSLDLSRLAKVWALTNSTSPGEALAARDRAEAMLKRAGKTLADAPILLGLNSPSPPKPPPFVFVDMGDPLQAAAYEAHERQRHKAWVREHAIERKAVIARYGSKEAALAPTPEERLLLDAVKQWTVRNRKGWIASIDGWEGSVVHDPTPRVKQAASEAYPLPTTITVALAEYNMWEARGRDLMLVTNDSRLSGSECLDLPAQIRYNLIFDLLREELRAQSLTEIAIRQRWLYENDQCEPSTAKVILADVEHVASL